MQQTTGVAVLATHLAHTDRRALSQAWYSALHLAESTPLRRRAPLASPTPSPGAPPGAARATGAAPATPAPRAARPAHAAVAPRDGKPGAACGALERRAPSELARRIERALTHRSPHEKAASFTVSAADGRVHLMVRSDGVRTRVVAVCAPPLRERVERALAQVRFALAGRGVLAEVA
jgi:hypothetical protein